jgi:hypothetical protein
MEAHLRDHPKLKWHGISTWPPQAGGAHGGGDISPALGEGNLADVRLQERDYIGPRRLAVTIEHQGREYGGQAPADDPEVITRLYSFLKRRIGHSLNQISDEIADL